MKDYLLCDSFRASQSRTHRSQAEAPELKIDEHAQSMRQHLRNETMLEMPQIRHAKAGYSKALGQVGAYSVNSLTQARADCRSKRIGIAGYYGVGNLGDETVVAILIHKIKEYYPNAEIAGFSLNPVDTAGRHGIKAFHIRWQNEVLSLRSSPPPPRLDVRPPVLSNLKQLLKKWPILFKPLKGLKICFWDLPGALLGHLSFLRRSFYRLQGFDLLIVPGSGALTDWWGGAWVHPYSFLSWGFLARMTRTKVIALSIGAERLNTRIGKAFCKWFLRMAHYRSFRDRSSRDSMEALGLKGDNPVFPDQGFALLGVLGCNLTESTQTECQQPSAGLIVGVSPIDKRTCVAEGEDDSWHNRYIENLSAFLSWLIQKGYRIAFCPTDKRDALCVQQIIANIKAACPHIDVARSVIQDPIATMEGLIARMQLCDLMIASRFHGVVLPLALKKPVLAISAYSRKIADVMCQCGQADFHLGVNEADVEHMIRVFQALEQNRHAITEHLEGIGWGLRACLDRQYEEVFGRSSKLGTASSPLLNPGQAPESLGPGHPTPPFAPSDVLQGAPLGPA